jgi:signal transduction histidine kinase
MMDNTLIHDIEGFFNNAPGIALLHSLAVLAGLGLLAVLLCRKPRWEWKRALLVAVLIVLFHAIGLAADALSLGWNPGGWKSVTANMGRSFGFLLALAYSWYFLFPRPSRFGDTLAVVLAILAILGAVISTVSFFLFGGNLPYNGNWISLIWDAARGILLLGAVLLLLIRRPSFWGISLLALLLLLAGVLAQASLSDSRTYLPGLASLFDLFAFPLIAMRLALAAATGITLPSMGPPARLARQSAAESVPQLADLMLTSEEDLPQALATWLCGAMHAEVCLLVARSEKEKNDLLFFAGFDRVHAQDIPFYSIPSEASPQLYFAVTGRQTMSVDKKDSEELLHAVATGAGLAQAGPGLFVPLNVSGENPMGILLLASHSGEEWSNEDQEALRVFAGAGAAAIQRAHTMDLLRQELEAADKEIAGGSVNNETLQQDKLNLETRLQQAEQEWQKERQRAEGLAALVQEQDSEGGETAVRAERIVELQRQLADASSHAQEETALLQTQLQDIRAELAAARQDAAHLPETIAAAASFRNESQRLQEELRALRAQGGAVQARPAVPAEEEEIHRLRAALAETEDRASKEIERLQNELRRTLTEYTHLQSALLQPPPSSEHAMSKTVESSEEAGMINSLISEIRQPLSSMVGYADLLLSESAGILGAMQRKFLERIRASTTRTEALFDDLLQLILLPGKVSAPRIQPVDVPSLIDSAVSGMSDVVREKNLVLRLDIDEEMPPVEMDRDALQQIINHLVQNAVLATPSEKEVFLTAHAPLSGGQSRRALLLTVKDSGPGIAPEEQPRVFTRLYRNEGPLIEGLGDSGVGLAVARTLAEALGGRIWLESQPGHGSTFFVLLPVLVSTTPGS